MPVLIDLTGRTFGHLTVIGRAAPRGTKAAWQCRCVCGKEYPIDGQYLRSGAQTSCGCRSKHTGKLQDLTGQRFGRLVVLERAGTAKGGQARWRCRCDCGGETVALGNNLRRQNHTLSCGCVNRERTAAVGRAQRRHGEGSPGKQSAEFATWMGMRERCRTPSAGNYAQYGGRGIRVCERWERYENFLADMGRKPSPAHSIDRIDPDRDYTPDNCRWATATQQQRNRRITKMVEWEGRRLPLIALCEELAVPYERTRGRLHKGWPLREALFATRYRRVTGKAAKPHAT